MVGTESITLTNAVLAIEEKYGIIIDIGAFIENGTIDYITAKVMGGRELSN